METEGVVNGARDARARAPVKVAGGGFFNPASAYPRGYCFTGRNMPR